MAAQGGSPVNSQRCRRVLLFSARKTGPISYTCELCSKSDWDVLGYVKVCEGMLDGDILGCGVGILGCVMGCCVGWN